MRNLIRKSATLRPVYTNTEKDLNLNALLIICILWSTGLFFVLCLACLVLVCYTVDPILASSFSFSVSTRNVSRLNATPSTFNYASMRINYTEFMLII